MTYPQLTHLAFYYSAQQIEQLERSLQQINQGNSIQTSVGMWFLSIESYINSILRIACLVEKRSFDDLKTKDFGPRIAALFDILKLDRMPFYSGTFQKLEEFKRYRNELFHDRSNDKPLDFRKTSFSGNPMYANQVDVMQASVIALETYQTFRYVIPRLDLMPQVMLTKEDSGFFARVDDLYKEVLRPYFEQALLKHSLTSSVDLHVAADCLPESQIFSDSQVEVIIKAHLDEKFNTTPTTEETSIGHDLFEKVRGKVIFDAKKQIKLANYYRN